MLPGKSPRTRRRKSLITELLPRLQTDGKLHGEEQFVREMVETCLKLLRDHTRVADVKLLNAALRELRYAFKVFAPYAGVRKVSIFGSARTRPDAAAYRTAHEFARRIAAEGYMVITGAGSGIMRACQEGVFMKEADAAALFPGGFGTHDEAYECLTLVQTGKTKPMPIVFVDAPRGTYWKTWKRYVEEHLLRHHLISKEDMALFKVTTSVDQAVEEITRFYRVYHSSRTVGHQLVIRLVRPLPEKLVDRLSHDFADILLSGTIVQGPALAEEDEPELAALPRLVLHFNRTNFGRLRQLIDRINHDG